MEVAKLKTKNKQSSRNFVKKGYKLKYLLKAIRMGKYTYYFEISKVDVIKTRNTALIVSIKNIFEHKKGRYGGRRVHKELVNRGYDVNHKRV